MAKNNGGNKKPAAKKATAPKADMAEEKVETPVEGTNAGSGEYDPELPSSPGPVDETPAVEETPSENPQPEVEQELAQEPDPTPEEEPEASLPPEDESPKEEDIPTMPEPIAETKAPLTEETWRDRVLDEAKELKIKMNALKAAVEGNKVPATEVGILNEQYDAMYAYYLILNRRLS